MKYVSKYVFFAFSEVRIIIIWMRTRVNDSIHVQVQIIKLRNLKFKRNRFTNIYVLHSKSTQIVITHHPALPDVLEQLDSNTDIAH